jgi:hypothetical protein
MNDTATVSLSGGDTLIIQGIPIVDVADGDYADLTFPNDLMAVKTGKNGNSIYAFNSTGKQCDLKMRVIRGSRDDATLNSFVEMLKYDPASFILLGATLVKRAGDGQGFIAHDTYKLSGGIPSKQVGVKSNAEGDTEQAVAIYEFKFTNSDRAIF